MRLSIALTLIVLSGLATWGLPALDRFLKNRERKKWQEDLERRQAEYQKRLLHKRKSHEKNHAGQVYNWLKKELAQYEDVGIRVGRSADNSASYTITIERVVEEFAPSHPIVQIRYDFSEKTDGYVCHLFVGAYGPDMLLYVVDHNPMYGLEDQVIDRVRREALRAREHSKVS